MNIILISLIALAALVIIVGAASLIFRKDGHEEPIVKAEGDCASCSGDDAGCEQMCMMEAATKKIEYYDDEELDRFCGREADDYSPEEVEEFMDVLQTMRPEEVKGWNRSLILRGINVPNEMKDELIAMIQG